MVGKNVSIHDDDNDNDEDNGDEDDNDDGDGDAHLSEHTRLAKLLKAGRCVAQNPQGGRLALFIFHNIPLSSQKLHLRWMKYCGVIS